MTEKWNFWKYEGNGNDFILILLNPDNTYIQGLTTSSSCLENYLLQKNFTSSKIEKLCDRHYGIGADGVIFLNITKDHDGNRDYEDSETDTERKHESAVKCRMKIYNSDGTIAKLCGNGLRCVVKFLHHHHHPNDDKNYDIMTDVGLARALIGDDELVTINLDPPQLFFRSCQSIQNFRPISMNLPHGSYDILDISLGNPHAVTFVSNLEIFQEHFPIDGQALSTHEYFPDGVNAEFVQVISPHHLIVRVWERGAGPTLACGTGACAAVIASILMGYVMKDSPCKVTLPGGDLHICWRNDDSIQLTGPARFVFQGVVDLSSWK